MDSTGLCLLTVHAHPDDEASKGAGTVSLYHAAGVRTVLVDPRLAAPVSRPVGTADPRVPALSRLG